MDSRSDVIAMRKMSRQPYRVGQDWVWCYEVTYDDLGVGYEYYPLTNWELIKFYLGFYDG
jgi:hypothetical protein